MKLAFFHTANEYRTEFSSKTSTRPTFYWFSDRFHDHYGYGIEGIYFYLFLKDPVEAQIALRARIGEKKDFHDLYSLYLYFKNNLMCKLENDEDTYLEPPILMSFSKMVPDVAAVYHKDSNEYEILYPETSFGVRFKLYGLSEKKRWPISIPFNKVPELVEVLPELNESIPFQEPEYNNDGKYVYEKWVPMVTEKNGTWL